MLRWWNEFRRAVRMLTKGKWKLMLKPGDQAPAFSAPDHEGNVRTLEEFRGKKVLLWFYPKADTPG